ncbi:MAG: amino acid adenylation domain-containing protein [Chloroflexota bacterium]
MTYHLSQLLTHRAAAAPRQTAIIDRKEQLTYQELDKQSNRVAHRLRESGVVRGDRVGLYLDKSIDAVVAIFGILKTGAAYVPLDPAAPAQRIGYIIENCQMKAVITSGKQEPSLQKALASSINLPVILLADDAQSLASCPATPPCEPGNIENDLAYILYTSGSTGTPKGVMISHRAALTFVDWACGTFNIQPTDRVSNHAPFHFDLSIFDIFATIKAGATIVLVPPSLSIFPLTLADYIAEQEISIWYSVPSALTLLVRHGQLERHTLPQLRTVLFAGEVFPVKYLRQLMAQIPHASYHNLYGPTETNVCTWYTVPPLDPARTAPLSIGKGCANSEILVLNRQDEIVAPGEIGELCVRGPGLMSGYWGLPERTAQSLTPYQVHEHLGPELIYRTGDLVQEDEEGNYTYLGRRDSQIKSRGYRIELGEIETALYSHPAIEEAAVIPIPDDEIGNQIKAFVVTHTDENLKVAELQTFCAMHIPKYMVPHQIELCDALPKTSTGKIDKRALKARGNGMLDSNYAQASPFP